MKRKQRMWILRRKRLLITPLATNTTVSLTSLLIQHDDRAHSDLSTLNSSQKRIRSLNFRRPTKKQFRDHNRHLCVCLYVCVRACLCVCLCFLCICMETKSKKKNDIFTHICLFGLVEFDRILRSSNATVKSKICVWPKWFFLKIFQKKQQKQHQFATTNRKNDLSTKENAMEFQWGLEWTFYTERGETN